MKKHFRQLMICFLSILFIVGYFPARSYAATSTLTCQELSQPFDQISVSYTNAPISGNSVYIVMMPTSADTSPESVSNKRIQLIYLDQMDGTVNFTAPWETGEYRFDMYINKDTFFLGSSGIITIAHNSVSVSNNVSSAIPKTVVQVSYSNIPLLYGTFMVMMKEGSATTPSAVSNERLGLIYLDNTKSSGTVSFTLPDIEGNYVFRVHTIRDTLLLGASGTVSASKVVAPITIQSVTATPTAASILVNNVKTTFDAYTIGGNNYFKLRDLATVVNGTEKNFEVTWDGSKNAINLISNITYTSVGGEMSLGINVPKTATSSTARIYKDGVEIKLTAYTINNNNYFKLRDIGQSFNIGVTWDGINNTIVVNTAIGYTAP